MFYQTTGMIGSIEVKYVANESLDTYSISLTSLAALCGKKADQVIRFFTSKFYQKEYGGSFQAPTVIARYSDSNATGKISIVPVGVAVRFVKYWAMKGNQQAFNLICELAVEALEKRAATAFGALTEMRNLQIQAETDKRLKKQEREECKAEHMMFQRVCYQLGLNPAETHDLITLGIWGMTAEEARGQYYLIDDIVWYDRTVGINHHKDVTDSKHYKAYRIAKKSLGRWQKGTPSQRIQRSIDYAKRFVGLTE